MSMTTRFFNKKLNILTHNVDGEIYMIEADSIKELFDDWNGECITVPENDATVYFASYNGEVFVTDFVPVTFKDVLVTMYQIYEKLNQ